MESSTAPAEDPIEHDLLRIFRLFAGLLWALLSVSLAIALRRRALPLDLFMLANWGQTGALTLYLGWPRLRALLGAAYLPIALIVASIVPVVGHGLDAALSAAPLQALGVSADLNRLYFWLMFPLVLVAARYSFRAVLLFASGTALLSALLALPTLRGVELWLNLQYAGARWLLFVLAGYLIARIAEQQRAQRAALLLSNAELSRYAAALDQLATSRERNRLARELHDTLAHTLSAIDMQLKALDVQLVAQPDAARATLRQTQELTSSGLHEARRALQALRASPVEQLGLALALRQLGERTAERAGIAVDIAIDDAPLALRQDIEGQLYRIAEEALQNSVRHARAARLALRLERRGPLLALHLSDDGTGFDVGAAAAGRFGLRGIRERAALIGATVDMRSGAGGTQIDVTLPVKREERGVRSQWSTPE